MKRFLLLILLAVGSVIYGDELLVKEVDIESQTTKPKYLYKILSSQNWQATQNCRNLILSAADNAFIHFSTEDQLERIVAKYWSDAPEFAVLKIEVERLEGDLVYEPNPGGSAHYYHLYKGHIPFHAIVEARIIYRERRESSPGLPIVHAGDPVLRVQAKALSKEEILSPEIQALIEKMAVAMRAAEGVGLAAPQIGRSLQIAVIEDVHHAHLTREQLEERERRPVPFHVIINPRLYIEESETAEFFEVCLSVPEFIGMVPRAKAVRVECLNERAEPIVIEAEGWYARILQHEIDHLNGVLYIDRAHLPTVMTEENYLKIWKGHSPKEIASSLCECNTTHQK